MAIITFVTTRKKQRAYLVEQPSFYFLKDAKGKLKRKRAIQYCPDLESIFIDEQKKIDPNPTHQSIRIERGKITVDDQLEPAKVEFLLKHRRNPKDFRVLNVEKEEMYEIQAFEKTDKARAFILEANDNVIRAMAIEFISPSAGLNRSPRKLRIQLRKQAEQYMTTVDAINSFMDDLYNQEMLLVSAMLSEKIIALNGKTFTWADSDEKIFVSAQAQDAPKNLAIWLKNDKEGRQVQSIFADKLKKPNN